METQILTPTLDGTTPHLERISDWFATEEACQAFLEKLR